jgi:hypothetical protein
MEGAGEGGAWGIALLAAHTQRRLVQKSGESLEVFLSKEVFAGSAGTQADPDEKDASGFNSFMEHYSAGLAIERAAVEHLQ